MEAPKEIYLQVCGDCPQEDCKKCKFSELEDNITWCTDKIFDRDVKYIRADLALSIDDLERLHALIYAVKNNKQGVFTFTKLADEQYEEVLRRFNKNKEEKK